MATLLSGILAIVVLILWGIFATFFIVLNFIKQEERRKRRKK